MRPNIEIGLDTVDVQTFCTNGAKYLPTTATVEPTDKQSIILNKNALRVFLGQPVAFLNATHSAIEYIRNLNVLLFFGLLGRTFNSQRDMVRTHGI